jgi:hypothetical protein
MKMIKVYILITVLFSNIISFQRKKNLSKKSKANKKLRLKTLKSTTPYTYENCNLINSLGYKEENSECYYNELPIPKGIYVKGDFCKNSWTALGISSCYIPYRTIKENISYDTSTYFATFPSIAPPTFKIYLSWSVYDANQVVKFWNTQRAARRTLIESEIVKMNSYGNIFFSNFNSYRNTVFQLWNDESSAFAQTDISEKQAEIKKYALDTIAKENQITDLQKVLVKNVYERDSTTRTATCYQTLVNDINSRIKANVEGYAVVSSADDQMIALQKYIGFLKKEVPELKTNWDKIETLTRSGSEYLSAIELLMLTQIYF